MEMDPDLLLGQIAVKNSLLTQADVDEALRVQREEKSKGVERPIGQVLVELGRIREEDLRLLVAGHEYYRERHAARRIGELAVANGLATQAQVDDALARQKAGFDVGRGLVQPIGSILVDMGVLKETDVEALLLVQARQGASAARRKVPDTNVELAARPEAPPPLSFPPRPSSRLTRSGPAHEPPRRSRRPIAVALGIIVLAALVPAGWLLFRELVARQRDALVRNFTTSVAAAERATDPDVAEAAWQRAVDERERALRHATRYGWDASFLRVDGVRAAKALARLRESRAGVERIREAREASRRPEPDPAKAVAAVEEVLALIGRFEEAAGLDDPWRRIVAAWKEEARKGLTEAEARLSVEAGQARAGAVFLEAKALYERLKERVRGVSAAAVADSEVERSRALCQYFLGLAPADSRGPEVEGWLRELIAWEKEKARLAEEAARTAARLDGFERLRAAYDVTRKVVESSSAWAGRAIVEETLRAVISFQEGAAPDDTRLDEVVAWRQDLERWREEAATEAARLAEERETRPMPEAPVAAGPSEDLRKRIRASTVYVKAGRVNDQEARVLGSGYIVGARGYVITNRRVVSGMDWFTVGWDRSATATDEVSATLVAWSRNTDLAVLKLPAGDYEAIPLSVEPPALMQAVVVAGFPAVGAVGFHPGLTIESGRVTAERRDTGMDRGLFEMDAKTAPGNAGGPILDAASGQAIGIAASGGGDRTWAVPVAFLRREFAPLFNGSGYSARAQAPIEDAQGQLVCEKCKGQGLTCGRCKGKGGETLDCTDCGGRGYTEHFRAGMEGPGTKKIPCKFCQNGKVFYACPACAGSGRMPCPSCEIELR